MIDEPPMEFDRTIRDDDTVSEHSWPRLGEVITGTHRIERVIGQGGHGTVMLARDQLLDRPVALKFLHVAADQPEMRARVLDEARAMARLRHPNVVGIHSVGEWEGMPYLVMEYLSGATLQSYVDARGLPIDLDDAMGLFDQTCRGVSAIHAAGTTHNDLKPSNIILCAASRLVITDFGLASWRRQTTSKRGGTVGYIAPEVVRRDPVDPSLVNAGDIYSLGVLAFVLFAGRVPFHGDTPEQMIEHQLNYGAADFEASPSGLTQEFDDVITRALSPDPATRPRKVEELLKGCVAALAPLRTAHRATRVLVIEDDLVLHPWFQVAMTDTLPGADVACFANPVAALADAERQRPDLVITDIELPELSGFDVVRILRSRPDTAHVPIIAITGTGSAEHWQRLTTLGADGFMSKPFRIATMAAVVRRMLARANEDPLSD